MTNHYAPLRHQYEAHRDNARWWAKRWKDWGGDLAFKWAKAEYRLARQCLKYLREAN